MLKVAVKLHAMRWVPGLRCQRGQGRRWGRRLRRRRRQHLRLTLSSFGTAAPLTVLVLVTVLHVVLLVLLLLRVVLVEMSIKLEEPQRHGVVEGLEVLAYLLVGGEYLAQRTAELVPQAAALEADLFGPAGGDGGENDRWGRQIVLLSSVRPEAGLARLGGGRGRSGGRLRLGRIRIEEVGGQRAVVRVVVVGARGRQQLDGGGRALGRGNNDVGRVAGWGGHGGVGAHAARTADDNGGRRRGVAAGHRSTGGGQEGLD